VMVDNEDPFVAGRRQITAEAWGEKAFVLRWDPAMLVQEDVTAEFLRRRAEGRDHPPPPVIWEAVGLETEWAPFGGRVSNEVGTPLEITGEGLVGLASKELNLQPQGYDFFEVKWKGDWVEPERPAGTLPAQFEWATYGAERVFMIPLTFEVSGDWGVARIPVSRSLSWLLAGNVRRMTIRVDSDRPVRVSVERIAIRRASRDGMIYIPPGKFTMGSDLDDYNRYELEPAAHEVFVRGFWIDRYEYPNEEGVVPRIDVDWYEAQALCDALGKRLCREAEWEKACKGPKMLRYPYGDDYDKAACWTDQEFDGNFPKPAGSFPDCVSGYGVYDMAGNVSEWTSDVWTRDEVRAVKGLASYGTMDNWDQLPVPEIPLLKGGDWGEASEDTRCAGHNHYHLPNATYRDDGLRCCMDAE
ncbi:MAG: formylglycine-generating enzyme family protein, partial [Candidatus Methylomirabilis sp.]|nr:formylglycine-generating enzyme family protein [Deltaproteobacteria bacterium]